jgi:hypothetical protein
VIIFAPHQALKLIAGGKLTFDGRYVEVCRALAAADASAVGAIDGQTTGGLTTEASVESEGGNIALHSVDVVHPAPHTLHPAP